MKRITINPITRLEGHGKIEIFLDEAGNVANAYFQVPELRGFEKFCEGRPVEELPGITCRICGVCPLAHHFASTKALDALFHVDPPSVAKKLRELMYSAYFFSDHLLNFYALGGPDFVVGPTAPAAERNILGVIAKAGLEVGKEVIKHRAYGQHILKILGGKTVHPICGLPGGVSKGLNEQERTEIENYARSCVDFAQFSLQLFNNIVLTNKEYVDLVLGDTYLLESYYMGLVDARNRVNFYDGQVRVVDPEGEQVTKFSASEYLDHIAERVELWTYLKVPYLKRIGWKGYTGGKESGVYRVGALARLNVAEGMATPLAKAEYERMYYTLGSKPLHNTLAYHWARLVEMLYAAEHLLELSRDEEITDPNIRTLPTAVPDEGIGVIEAARGTLLHHYKSDPDGIATEVNLIVATTHNHAAICMSIKKAAQELISTATELGEGVLNMVEMAFRAYDPCLACATHSLPGQMPLVVNIYDADGTLVKSLQRS